MGGDGSKGRDASSSVEGVEAKAVVKERRVLSTVSGRSATGH